MAPEAEPGDLVDDTDGRAMTAGPSRGNGAGPAQAAASKPADVFETGGSPRGAPRSQELRVAGRSSQVGALFVRLLRWNVPILSKLFRVLLGSDIYCEVPATLKLPHPYGITIHPSTVLGENVVILQNATIGSHYDVARWAQAPVIEDDVWIGPGAVVLGPITVGRGAAVGANAVVTKDVEPGRTVVGINRVLD